MGGAHRHQRRARRAKAKQGQDKGERRLPDRVRCSSLVLALKNHTHGREGLGTTSFCVVNKLNPGQRTGLQQGSSKVSRGARPPADTAKRVAAASPQARTSRCLRDESQVWRLRPRHTERARGFAWDLLCKGFCAVVVGGFVACSWGLKKGHDHTSHV